MAEYKGTIAGIGEIIYNEDGSINESSTNVIYPEFDATIRNFIVGKNCILEGLEIDNGVLTAGYCQAKGFVGHLPNNITLTYPNGYICAVFKVYKDDHTLDEFYISESSELISPVPQDDILHSTGTFYLPLYFNGSSNLTRNYPQNSVYSDYADIVSSRLEKGVVGTTHEVTTDDDKIATCEFVHNVIKKEINYDKIEVKVKGKSSGIVFPLEGTLILERKADYVVATYNIPSGEYVDSENTISEFEIDTIPQNFLPIGEGAYFSFIYKVRGSSYIQNGDYLVLANLLPNNTIGVTVQQKLDTGTVEQNHISGWKTKI